MNALNFEENVQRMQTSSTLKKMAGHPFSSPQISGALQEKQLLSQSRGNAQILATQV